MRGRPTNRIRFPVLWRVLTWVAAVPTAAVLAVETRETVLVLMAQLHEPVARRLGDFQVYWTATGALLHGRDLYAATTPGGLHFTYPPFAAGVLSVLHALPSGLVQVLWLAAVLAAALVVPILVCRRARGSARWSAVAFGVVVFLASDSLRMCLRWGQVGMFLLTVVVVDALVLPRRIQGAGVGLVAAFRVSPALVPVVALLRGRRRVALVAAVTAVAVTLLTAVTLPRESWQYWTDQLWNTRRVGSLRGGNLSLLGVLVRLGLPSPLAVRVLVVATAALLLAAWKVPRRRVHGRHDLLLVLTAGALLAEAVSPITWRHHWVWLPLAALLLYLDRRPLPAFAVAVVSALPFRVLAGLQAPGGLAQQVLFAVPVVCAVLVAFALLALPSSPAHMVDGEHEHDEDGDPHRRSSADRPLDAGVRAARDVAERHEADAPDQASCGVEGEEPQVRHA